MLEDVDESAAEELKRADHLIYVTLKYTRTADVIKNTIKRLISAMDFGIADVLKYLAKKKKVKAVPELPKLRADLLHKISAEFQDDIHFYYHLKAIDKAEYSKKEEYRKNVALLAHLSPKETVEVNMPLLNTFYQQTKDFIKRTEEFCE
ncbi:MAG TPA: hypothetical protein VJB87_05120 [Candidatus Nanoarchaeia archaeon]|nr:hypothetical protein [Candidatus Nanoarchaeia archaeon]